MLKVVKYKNYGLTMSSPQDESGYEHRFYWSFYQLSNNTTFVLQHIECWGGDKFIDEDFECSYGELELKNGTIFKYKFGQDFFEWFDLNPPVKYLKQLEYPTNDEDDCVKDFYIKILRI